MEPNTSKINLKENQCFEYFFSPDVCDIPTLDFSNLALTELCFSLTCCSQMRRVLSPTH